MLIYLIWIVDLGNKSETVYKEANTAISILSTGPFLHDNIDEKESFVDHTVIELFVGSCNETNITTIIMQMIILGTVIIVLKGCSFLFLFPFSFSVFQLLKINWLELKSSQVENKNDTKSQRMLKKFESSIINDNSNG